MRSRFQAPTHHSMSLIALQVVAVWVVAAGKPLLSKPDLCVVGFRGFLELHESRSSKHNV